jgi:NADH:ubiquinone oxidoreductase subunit H
MHSEIEIKQMKTVQASFIILFNRLVSESIQYAYCVVYDHIALVSITTSDVFLVSEVAECRIKRSYIEAPRLVGYHHELASIDFILFIVVAFCPGCPIGLVTSSLAFGKSLISLIYGIIWQQYKATVCFTLVCVCCCIVWTTNV